MASLETNKALAALLTAGVIASGAGVLSRIIYQPQLLEEPAYAVAVVEEGGAGPAVEEEPLPVRLAAADAESGAGVARRCASCHTFEAGGADGIGPHLHGVVGRDIASAAGFAYSDALAGMEGIWDYEALDHFIADPRGWAPGTKMAFAGIRNPQERADLLLYLRAESPDAPPLPEPEAAPPADAAAAEGEGAPADAEAAAAEPQPAEGAQEQATAQDQGQAPQPAAAPQEAPAAADQPQGEEVAAVEPEAQPQQEPAAPAEAPAEGLQALLASADAAEGETLARRCVTCHSFEAGGPAKIGPPLWDVVGREIAAVEGYDYSDALAGKEGVWDLASLDAYLANPRQWAPGTKMAFAGLRREEERAHLLLYLRSLSDDPAQLPGQG